MARARESKVAYSAEPITTVTARGTTEIPRVLRQRYRVTRQSRLRWTDTGKGLLVVPVDKVVAPRNGRRRQTVPRKPRMSDRAFLAWLDEWMQEPDDWTPEQWDDFERELRANRLKFRDIEL